MLDFLSLLIAIVALIVARKTFNQAALLRARLDAIENAASAAAAPRQAPPPLGAREEPLAPSSADTIRTEPAAEAPPPLQPAPAPAKPAIPVSVAAPPPLAQPGPGFEERIGTRWVVWIGGLTLALGGFFMVRYSIEAGLLGPGVRTLLGGAFALALLAAIVFLVRGTLGYTDPWAARTPEEPFRSLDRKIYSPLCLAIGLGFLFLVVMRLL